MKERGYLPEQSIDRFGQFLQEYYKAQDPSEIRRYNAFISDNQTQLNDYFERMPGMGPEELVDFFEFSGADYSVLMGIADEQNILRFLYWAGVGNRKTLSIGCGSAAHEIFLAKEGLIDEEIVGLDFAPSLTARAEEIARRVGVSNIQFVNIEVSKLNYDRDFSQVLIIDSLQWMLAWQDCLAKSHRALEENGQILLAYSLVSPVLEINPNEVVDCVKNLGMTVDFASMSNERVFVSAFK